VFFFVGFWNRLIRGTCFAFVWPFAFSSGNWPRWFILFKMTLFLISLRIARLNQDLLSLSILTEIFVLTSLKGFFGSIS